jgi:glycosyltransferase involved in cell wall biosynthesis
MKTPQPPLVSILINNYNYGRFLSDAINSALNQTYPNVEVVVVDDGSTDNSREIIAGFGSKIVAVLKNNGGQASAFNAGFAASKGDWIHFLDSDDVFNPNKVQWVGEIAAKYPTVGMIAHNLEYCDADEAPLDFAPPLIRQRRLVDDRSLARRGKLSAYLPATSGLCVRRDALERVLPIPEEIRVGADNYLKWVGLSLFPVLLLPEAPAKQRIHGGNLYTIANEDKSDEDRIRCAMFNATLTFHLKKEHPHLARLAWKQYGRILYSFRSCGSGKSRQAMATEIRARYSVMEFNPECIFYTVAAFTKAFAEDILKRYGDA